MCRSEKGDSSFQGVLHAESVKGILETVEQEDKLCHEVEIVREFT